MSDKKNPFLLPSEIDRESVLWIFEKAMFEVERIHDEDEDMILCKENGWKYMVRVDPKKEMVTFHCPMGIRIDASEKRKLRFVNAMSKKFILINVALIDEDTMLSEYQFLYDCGFSVRFLINTFKRFVEISRSVASEAARQHLAPESNEDDDPFGLFSSPDESEEESEESSGSDEESNVLDDGEDMDELMRRLFESGESPPPAPESPSS